MVYKRFIKKKNGTMVGPYYYESYRDGNKVKKRYLGRKLPKKHKKKGKESYKGENIWMKKN